MSAGRTSRRGANGSVVEGSETALQRSDDLSVRYHVRKTLQVERIADTGTSDTSGIESAGVTDDD